MNRDQQPTHLPRSVERHRQSRAVLIDSICEAVAAGQLLHEIAGREHMPRLATLRRWLAEDEAFRTRYEKACIIGRTFIMDDVVALADALPGTRLAETRLKLSARKWWIAQTAREAAAKTPKRETKAEAKAREKAEKKREHDEWVAGLNAYWEARARKEEEARLRKENEANTQPNPAPVADAAPPTDRWVKPDGTIVYGPRPSEPTPPAPQSAASEPPAPAPASPKPKPQLVRSLYDFSAIPPPKSYTESKNMSDWDPFAGRTY